MAWEDRASTPGALMVDRCPGGALNDGRCWGQSERINVIQRAPFAGIGKPELLRHALAGDWSRRINDEHRLVYKVDGEGLMIAAARYHD